MCKDVTDLKNTNSNKKWDTPTIPIISIFIIILAIIGSNFNLLITIPSNLYNIYKYIPSDIIDYYVKNPIQDVSIHVPVYFDSEFKFPDIGETVDIQINARMRHEFYLLLNYTIDLIPGNKDSYNRGLYSKDVMFIYGQLSDVNAIQVDGARNYGELYFNLEGIDANDIPFFLTQLLIDHCYSKEINKYTPDSFYRLGNENNDDDDDFFLLHHDFIESDIIKQLVKRDDNKPLEVNINVYIIAANIYDLDMKEAIEQFTIPLFETLSDYFTLKINIINYGFALKNENDIITYIDNEFPTELSDLPLLKYIYQSTKNKFTDSSSININFVYYPYIQGGEEIKTKIVDNKLIYSENENMYLKIGDWGSVYFTQLPDSDHPHITLKQLEDCIWSYNEALLDIIGAPNEAMAPEIRIDTFKRYLVIQNLVYYSSLLHKLKQQVKWNNWKKIITIDPKFIKSLAEKFATSLEMRRNVINQLALGNISEALVNSGKMLNILRNVNDD
jgi:hypothetical protein